MSKTIKKESQKTRQAMMDRQKKHQDWPDFATNVAEYFSQVAQNAKEENYPENLYVYRNDSKRIIQLYSGAHPIDVIYKYDLLGNENGLEVLVEHDAALVVSQAANGSAAIFLFPYKSSKQSQVTSHIIWKVFGGPEDIKLGALNSATKDFFAYMRVSSAVLTESLLDRLRIRYLEIRNKKYSGEGNIAKITFSHWFWTALAAIGAVASIYSLFV